MKKLRIKFLTFLLTLTMLLSVLVLPAQAVVNYMGKPNSWDATNQYYKTFDTLTIGELGGEEKLSANTGYSIWAESNTTLAFSVFAFLNATRFPMLSTSNSAPQSLISSIIILRTSVSYPETPKASVSFLSKNFTP